MISPYYCTRAKPGRCRGWFGHAHPAQDWLLTRFAVEKDRRVTPTAEGNHDQAIRTIPNGAFVSFADTSLVPDQRHARTVAMWGRLTGSDEWLTLSRFDAEGHKHYASMHSKHNDHDEGKWHRRKSCHAMISSEPPPNRRPGDGSSSEPRGPDPSKKRKINPGKKDRELRKKDRQEGEP